MMIVKTPAIIVIIMPFDNESFPFGAVMIVPDSCIEKYKEHTEVNLSRDEI